MKIDRALNGLVLLACIAFSCGQTVLETAASMKECWDDIFTYDCELTTRSEDSAVVALGCGEPHVPAAENFVSHCAKAPDGEYCLNRFQFLTEIDLSEAAMCASAVAEDPGSCSTACRNFLQSAISMLGCCLTTIFNERLSPLLLQHDIQVSLAACSLTAEPACISPITIDLTPQNTTEPCTQSEFWGRISEFLCSSENQGYVDYILEQNSLCRPLAQNQIDGCGLGPDNKYCVQLFETSFNPSNPMRTLSINPVLRNAVDQCANYSSFQSDGCSMSCKSAIEAAIDSFGCCINVFNDTVNEVLSPYFSADVMVACGLESPGRCESLLRLGSGAEALRSTTVWVYMLWLAISMAGIFYQL